MNILAIEPYYDGSHKAFIDGFIANSKHNWTLLTMPARKWKWRMRGAAIEMARQANELIATGQSFDAVFTCDMMSLTDFTALAAAEISSLPKIVYFHENQITYPCRVVDERDYQFAITNITTALAANSVWFNSEYHKDDFLGEAKKILRKMPDFKCLDVLETIKEKSHIITPCTDKHESKLPVKDGSLKIVWAARWEHDKNPEDFFTAMSLLKEQGLDFRLSVTGQSFRDMPEVFSRAKDEFADYIDNWGFLETPAHYHKMLADSDVFVSTAIHEFFGISAVEAAAAGCCVMVPKRLAYPEVFKGLKGVFYDGTPENLATKLITLAKNRSKLAILAEKSSEIGKKHQWQHKIDIMETVLEKL